MRLTNVVQNITKEEMALCLVFWNGRARLSGTKGRTDFPCCVCHIPATAKKAIPMAVIFENLASHTHLQAMKDSTKRREAK